MRHMIYGNAQRASDTQPLCIWKSLNAMFKCPCKGTPPEWVINEYGTRSNMQMQPKHRFEWVDKCDLFNTSSDFMVLHYNFSCASMLSLEIFSHTNIMPCCSQVRGWNSFPMAVWSGVSGQSVGRFFWWRAFFESTTLKRQPCSVLLTGPIVRA